MASETTPPPRSAPFPGSWAQGDARDIAHVTVPHASSLPIIALAPAWDDAPPACRHLLRELARTRRVLWIHTARRISGARGGARERTLASEARRVIATFTSRPTNLENDLWVAALPSEVTRTAVTALRVRLGIKQFQLWALDAEASEHVGALGEAVSLCYCADGHTEAPSVRALLRRVDLVLGANHAITEHARQLNRASFVCLHGVDHGLFARALDDATLVPPELAALPRPRIAVAGSNLDAEVIAEVARTRPAWSLAVLAPSPARVASAPSSGMNPSPSGVGPRVRVIEVPRAEQLPAYFKGLDVGLIAERVDDDAPFASPLELRELLAAGVPVVATPVPDITRYAGMCSLARTPDEIVAAIESELARGRGGAGLAARGARSAAIKNETWAARVAEVMRAVDEISQRKHPR